MLERLRQAKAQRGRLSAEDVDAVAAELGLPRAHIHGAASFYADLGFEPAGARAIRVCGGAACLAATGGAHLAAIRSALRPEGEGIERVYCLGYCYASPSALVGEDAHAGPDLVEQLGGSAERRDPPIPFAAAAEPVVLGRLLERGAPAWSVFTRVAREHGGSARVLAEVERSGLQGRGGAGFPAARKWRLLEAAGGESRAVVANGDEGDPGSYADRLLMERDPHGVLEGLALAALACRAERGYVYVRSEYPAARDALRQAILAAREHGLLGADAAGSGRRLELEVFEGAGSYVAGEETALLHSMEGLRGTAAARPPYPAGRGGLYGQPTAVHNVETLSALAWIVDRGGAAYASLGTRENPGTKLVCLNERFRRPGVYEVEFGVPIAEIVERLGGGLRRGRLRALQVGGPLGGFLAPDELETELTSASLAARGVALGHGSLVAFDDAVAGAVIQRHLWGFAAAESCGGCAPCRLGTRRGLELVSEDAAGGPALDDLLETLRRASLCGFGQGLPDAVASLRRVYADDLGGR